MIELKTPGGPLCPSRVIPVMGSDEGSVTVGEPTYHFKLPYSEAEVVERFQQWNEGGLIQDVFPELALDQREWLITGMTPSDWEKLEGEEDWDVDDEVEEPEDEFDS